MNRRDFLKKSVVGGAAVWAGCATTYTAAPRLGDVMTVRGLVSPSEVGLTLPHEHVVVDFAPAGEQAMSEYSREDVLEVVLPHIRALREAGCSTLVDATPAFLGRDPFLLQALSAETGIHIITNTGYYGARDDIHVPEHAFSDSVDDIAAVWIGEWRDGIGSSGVRPGFIKIGVDPRSLSEMDAALITAAARTHLSSGLTIASHTEVREAVFEQIDILLGEGVHPSAWIWVHAQAEDDTSAHVQAARRGAWVEFDGIAPDTIDRHVELVQNMKRERLLRRVLISQDAGWYSVGEPGGGTFRTFTLLITRFLPALREAGFSDEEIRMLTVENPADAYRIRIRRYHA